MNNIIEVKNIYKAFGSYLAVKDLSFSVKEGEIVGILGPNGAGKTTSMRILTGFLHPTKGTIKINGKNLFENPVSSRKLIGYVPEGSPLYNEMTVIDFLRFIFEARNLDKEKKDNSVDNVVNLLKLNNVLFQRIETLSKGYKRRVGLAQAIIHNPKILILDEPTDGLDPNQKNDVRKLIKELGKDKAIIISTHILEEINALCNRTLIISKGRLLIDDTPLNILKISSAFNNIEIAVEEKNNQELKQLLASSNIAKQVSIENNLCLIKTNNYKQKKIELDKFLKINSLTVKHLSISKGNMEEVFREMTSDE